VFFFGVGGGGGWGGGGGGGGGGFRPPAIDAPLNAPRMRDTATTFD